MVSIRVFMYKNGGFLISSFGLLTQVQESGILQYMQWIIILLTTVSLVQCQNGKCDQTPPSATVDTPNENIDLYHLDIQTSGSLMGRDGKHFYTPAQTYVLTITTTTPTRPFKWFMITAEDPDVDNNVYDGGKDVDVGILKTLDTGHPARYSESCYSSVESADYSEKNKIEVHWVSPKQSSRNQTIRIRATVAENNEAWYEGDDLTIVLYKDNKKSLDSPPTEPMEVCNLCSEARYEVIFEGKWSRVAHPRHYPSKPDENGFSHMVGASHAFDYTLWEQDTEASDGLKQVAEGNTTTTIEDEIISAMNESTGTRTLIRGKRRHHPYMSEPSHSLFRVDRYHHMFSIVVGMRPSPDWFLGTSRFELCSKNGWYEKSTIPLYPWDAGTMNGVSYESERSMTNPKDTVKRVEVGSFDRDSPFYQMNLNDLKPFALLTVRRLDVYPLTNADCSEEGEDEAEEEQPQPEEIVEGRAVPEEELEDPVVGESRLNVNVPENCYVGEWGAWSPCSPDDGVCGNGFQTRARYRGDRNIYFESYNNQDNREAQSTNSNCEVGQDGELVQYRKCYEKC